MNRLIGKKVKSKIYGEGIVQKCIDNDVLQKIIIKFGDNEKLLGFKVVIENRIITFEDEKMQEIAEELCNKKPIDKGVFPIRLSGCPAQPRVKKLSHMKSYGTNAQKIYDEMCSVYGWRSSLRGKFGNQQKCYAKQVDGKNSLWFVVHSNKSGDSYELYTNTFKNGMQIIEEEYIPSKSTADFRDNIGDVRVVFYKSLRKDYLFAGVYKQIDHFLNKDNHHVLVYEKISDSYPLDVNPFE